MALENKYGKSAVDATRRNALPPYLDELFAGGIGGAGVETHDITLTTSGWSNLQQSVVLTCGATDASDVVCAANNTSMDSDYYMSAFGVSLSNVTVVEGEEEGQNTVTFTFTAASMPTTNINVVIVIVNASTEGGVPVATISRVGVVKPDGTTISIDSNGTIHSIGGGGGGGSVTGVKGDTETDYRVGNVNLTPANIGAVPTSTTVNGHALTENITISKSDVGLGNVNNTSDLNKPISTATQTALDDKVDKETGKRLSTNDFTNALLTKLNGIEAGAQVNKVTGVKGNSESSYRVGNVDITKGNIGLGNVDNTSDANKPISTATQTALNGKVSKSGDTMTGNLQVGTSAQDTLPIVGYKVHDTRNVALIPTTLSNTANLFFTNKETPTSRFWNIFHIRGWSGTNYTAFEIASYADTGDATATAMYIRGSNGGSSWGAWRKVFDTSNPPTKAEIGLGNVDNTSDANKPISTATQTALDGKVDKVTGKGLSTNDFTDALLTKLNGIESGAQVNTVTGVKGNSESTYRTGNINITKANIGLGNVDNTSDANKPISTATQTALDGKVDKVTGMGLSSNDFTTAEKTKLSGIESGAQANTITGVKGNAESSYRTGNVNLTPANIGAVPTSRTVNGHALSANVTVTASDVGLGNVNNTSDLNKPISTATQSALDGKVNTTDIATTSDLGLVKPDGTSITIAADGTIHAISGGGGEGSSVIYYPQRTVSVASNAEILRITDPVINSNVVVLECTFDNPSAIEGDISWTSGYGYISFVGTCTSATKANITLAYADIKDSSILPSAYQQVEYISTSGTQYINTQTPLFSGTSFQIDTEFEVPSNVGYNPLFGTLNNANNRAWFTSPTFYFRYNNTNANLVTNATVGTKYTRRCVYNGSTLTITDENGNTISSVGIARASNTNNVTLFLYPTNHYGTMKLYSFKMYRDGTLLRDFYPCYRLSDSVIGLYDLVEGIFFVNNGTGTFGKGSNV